MIREKINFHIRVTSQNIERGFFANWNEFATKIRNENNNTIQCFQEAQLSISQHQLIKQSLEKGDNFQIIGTNENKAKIIISKDEYIHIEELNHFHNSEFQNNINIIKCQQSTDTPLMLIINVYSPQESFSAPFYELLREKLEDIENELSEAEKQNFLMIITGDFNCILDNTLKNVDRLFESSKFSQTRSMIELSRLMVENGLDDIFEHQDTILKYPHGDVFTNEMSSNAANPGRKKRLDRFLISDNFSKMGIQATYERTKRRIFKSTHFGIKLDLSTLNGQESSQKSNRFHTDDKLLKELPQLKEIIKISRRDVEKIFNDDHLAKILYNKLCQHYDDATEYKLDDNIEDEIDKILDMYEYIMEKFQDFLKKELKSSKIMKKQHQDQEISCINPGSRISRNNRDNIPLSVENNKKLMKKREKSVEMKKLQSLDGEKIITDEKEIQDEALLFYNNLFNIKSELADDELERKSEEYVKRFAEEKKISEEDYKLLDKPYQKDELEKVWRWYKSKSTAAGKDGITYAYLFLSRDALDPFLLQILNFIGKKRKLPKTMTEVMIKLLPKKNNLTNLKNWRPISLMNTSTKIIAACINNRIVEVIPHIVGDTQFGFVKQRNIDQGINLVQKVRYELNQKHNVREGDDQHIAALSIDFEKAFDRSNFKYFETVLRKLKFPESTINQILALTSLQHGQVIINNNISDGFFEFGNGIRQGSPLSPSIFLLIIEPMIFNCLNFIEVFSPFENKVIRSISYADDVTLLIKNQEELNQVINNFQKYEDVSNMKINLDKSNLIYMKEDIWLKESYVEEFEESPIKNIRLSDAKEITFLGVPFNGEYDWKKKFEKIQKQLWFSLLPNVPLNVRAKLVNTFIMSQVYGKDPHCPLSTKEIEQLEEMIQSSQFKYTVGIENLKLAEDHGGFNLMSLITQLDGRRSHMIYQTVVGNGLVETQNKELLQWLAICFTTIFADCDDSEKLKKKKDISNTKNLKWWNSALENDKSVIFFRTFGWYEFLNGQFEKAFNSYIKKLGEFKDALRDYKSEVHELDIQNNYIKLEDILYKVLPNVKIPKALQAITANRIKFTLNIKDLLKPEDLVCLASWIKVFHNSDESTEATDENEKLEIHVENKANLYKKLVLNEEIGEEKVCKVLKDKDGNHIEPDSFRRLNKKRQRREEEVHTRTPTYPVEYGDETNEDKTKRYAKFWAYIENINKHKPGYLETLHLWNLGKLEHRYFSNNGKQECCGCKRQNETIYHVFEKCEFTHYLWEHLGFKSVASSPFSLTELTTPTEFTENEKVLRKMSLWIDALIQARITRKNDRTCEEAVSATKYKMRSIQQKYGFRGE